MDRVCHLILHDPGSNLKRLSTPKPSGAGHNYQILIVVHSTTRRSV